MTIDIEAMRAELRRDARRFAWFMTIAMVMAAVFGVAIGVLFQHLAGTICR